MRYLITGTAGFIGFHLAKRLLDEGHFVTGFDGMTPYYDVALKEKRHAILARSNGFNSDSGQPGIATSRWPSAVTSERTLL